MDVPPHPHTGLQTVSWLFAGEIEHRDSAGSLALVRPGELNLMTAGHGIQHSEVSTANAAELHGTQLWIALPEASRDMEPFFEHTVPQPITIGGATARVFVGALAGTVSAARVFSPLVGAQLDLPAGAILALPVAANFEHGVLLDRGELTVDGENLPVSNVAFVPAGARFIQLSAGDSGARALLLGGSPFEEQIIMWWNFIGRTHEEIEQYRHDWQLHVIEQTTDSGRFGAVRGYHGSPLPAPEMPTVRLKARD